MKNALLFISLFLINTLSAQMPLSFAKEQQEAGYHSTNESDQYNMMKAIKLGFTENIGQIQEEEVFFYNYNRSKYIAITNQGITLIFNKSNRRETLTNSANLYNNNSINNDPLLDTNWQIQWERIDIQLENATILKQNIQEEQLLPYLTNWYKDGVFTNIKTYGKLVVKNVYPGIDWVLYNTTEGGFKYDFVIHVGANPNNIRLNYVSKNRVELNDNGSLFLNTNLASIKEKKPFSYLLNEPKTEVASAFYVNSVEELYANDGIIYNTKIEFEISNFNSAETLVIDPSLQITLNYDANDESYNYGATSDEANNVYFTGSTVASSSFPLVNPGGSAYYSGVKNGGSDAFIMKFNSAGTLMWSTYWGGDGGEVFNGIACNNAGKLAVVGTSTSSAATRPDVVWAGAYNSAIEPGSNMNCIVLNFNYTGQCTWATAFGVGSNIGLTKCAFDSNNKLYVVGYSFGNSLPIQNLAGAYNDNNSAGCMDAYLGRFSSSGVFEWGTYIGGYDASNSVYEYGRTIAIDGSNNVYIGGGTNSPNFPTSSISNAWGALNSRLNFAGGQDGFLVKLNSSGALLWSTYIGGTGYDDVSCIKIKDTHAYIVGHWGSGGTPNMGQSAIQYYHAPAAQPVGAYVDYTLNGTTNTISDGQFGLKDMYAMKFNTATDVLTWSTLIGGTDEEFNNRMYPTSGEIAAINSCGNLFITCISSTNLLTANGANTGLPGQNCDAGQTMAWTVPSFFLAYNYYLAAFNSNGAITWGTFNGESASYLESPSSIVCTPSNDVFWMGGRTQWPDLSVNKFTKRTLSLTQGGATSCSCTATVVPAATCAGTFSYAWTGAGSGTANVRSSLCNGNYSVTVTDNIMCQTTPINFNVNNCAIIILPVEVTNFDAVLLGNNDVELSWKTQSERNNDYFTIEKSIDGENWEYFAKVKGSGNSATEIEYSLMDENPTMNLNYYRLSQTDFDGTRKIIDIREVMLSAKDKFVLAPNPGDLSFRIYGKRMDEVSFEIINSTGQLIHIEKNSITNEFVEIDAEQLESGVYFVRFPNENPPNVQRIVIQH